MVKFFPPILPFAHHCFHSVCQCFHYSSLNTVDEDIKWTTEGEVVKDIEGLGNRTERGLAFLDTLSVINEDGTIKTRVYRKDTHTDQYLNFESNHPLEHNRGVVKTLAHRAKTVVSERDDRRKELDHNNNNIIIIIMKRMKRITTLHNKHCATTDFILCNLGP